jgi:hypothetical protein
MKISLEAKVRNGNIKALSARLRMGQIKKNLDTFYPGRWARKLIFQSEYLEPLSFKEQLSLLKTFPKFTEITILQIV